MVRARESRPQAAAGKLHLLMYRDMIRSRELSDRMFALNRQGRAAFAFTGQGHEAAQVGSAYAIKRGTDWVLPYYRDVGVMIALGMTPHDILLGLFARPRSQFRAGRQMPSHWSWPEARGRHAIERHSPRTCRHAAGIAYASKLRG